MTKFTSLMIIVTLFSMMIFLIIRNARYKAFNEPKNRLALGLLAADLILLILESFVAEDICLRISFDMMPVLLSFMLLNSSVWRTRFVRNICLGSIAFLLLLICIRILCMIGLVQAVPIAVCRTMMSVSSLCISILLLWGIWERVRDIKTVMKGGTVQSNLDLSVDLVYALLIISIPALASLSVIYAGAAVLQAVVALFALSLLIALGLRLACESFFAVLHEHERRIVESMKISQVELVNGVREGTYRELYDRIVTYFEEEKPFLDSRLTINDVVRVVFSNKVYISRAISQFTGRNFCQFVNYYRIAYSKECFRMNPDLKITALAEMSGFNSVVSYNMAFRLFMEENPSDWCRKERQKIRRKKK